MSAKESPRKHLTLDDVGNPNHVTLNHGEPDGSRRIEAVVVQFSVLVPQANLTEVFDRAIAGKGAEFNLLIAYSQYGSTLTKAFVNHRDVPRPVVETPFCRGEQATFTSIPHRESGCASNTRCLLH